MTNYSKFLKHRSNMERSLGRYIVMIIEGKDFSQFATVNPCSLVYPTGIVKGGTDRDIKSLVLLSGVSHRRIVKALKALNSATGL